MFQIIDDSDILNLNKYIYHKNINLKEIKLNFRTIDYWDSKRLTTNYFFKILNLKKLNILILEFNLKDVESISLLRLENLITLNKLSSLEKIILHFRIYTMNFGEVIPIEERVKNYFVKLFQEIKINYCSKMKITYGKSNLMIEVKKELGEKKR